MAYTFKETPSGTVEIFQNGQRISTASLEHAKSLGYQDVFTTPSGAQVSQSTGALITPASLEPAGTPHIPNIPTVPPPTDISKLIEDISLTPKEQEESDLNKRIQQLQESIAEKPAFEAEKTKEFGVEANRQAFEDMSRQLRDIQREQQMVPLTIQKESVGRGRTEAGVEPLEIGRRRTLAYDALVLSSRLDAAQGFLASSERKVLQAVENKFSPLEAELNAKMANAKMIRESPEATLQDKKRALQLEATISARTKAIEAAKEEQKNILKSVNEASSNLAKRGEFTSEAGLELDRISKTAKTNLEALTMLAPYLVESKLAGASAELQTFARLNPNLKVGTEEFRTKFDEYQVSQDKTNIPAAIEEFKSFFPNADLTTPTGQKQYLDWKARVGEAGREPDIVDLTGDEAVDAWARRINSGTDKISSVPNNLRNKVVARAKDFAAEDLAEDISLGFGQKLTPEALLEQLQTAYPEFTKSEIEKKITELKPQTITEEPQGFFSKVGSFFGSLFR